MDLGIRGRKAIVNGGSAGMGRSAALWLARGGIALDTDSAMRLAEVRDLLHGPWDNDRFLTVHPGERIAHSTDADIMKAVPSRPGDGKAPVGPAP